MISSMDMLDKKYMFEIALLTKMYRKIHTKIEDIGISHRYLSCNFVRICITMMILVKGNSIMDTYFSNTGYRCMFAHVWIAIIDN